MHCTKWTGCIMEKWHLNSGISAHSYPQSFQEVLMGQASKVFSTKSTGGRLGWRGERLYKEVVTMKNGGCNLKKKIKKKVYLDKFELNIRKSHPRTWPRSIISINSCFQSYWYLSYQFWLILNLLRRFLVKPILLQIYCFGLIGLRSIVLSGLKFHIPVPTNVYIGGKG